MPPRRRKATASPATQKSTPNKRRSTRRNQPKDDDIPEVFQEMLAEAVASSSAAPAPPLPPRIQAYIGRRKVSEEATDEPSSQNTSLLTYTGNQVESPPLSQPKSLQVIYGDSEDSEDEDVEFEDVDLEANDQVQLVPDQKSLQLDLAAVTTPSRSIRPRLATGAERKLRLDLHKAHLLLLLSALHHRNLWCENEQVQAILKPLVSRKTISLLHIDDFKPQADRARSFNRGIEDLCVTWRGLWTTTVRGMRRAHWRDEIDLKKEIDVAEDPIDFDDFKSAARTLSGSRDLGAQVFCALLRSVAVDTRLVCSLQTLPFSAVAKGQTSEKPKQSYEYAPSQDFGSSSTLQTRNNIVDSPYPIYWVEVYSPSTSTWIPLDPLVRNTINKARTAFEPPASDHLNSFSYVIAFEEDGSAKDVTHRYTTHFNAKIRKSRIESTRGGEEWWSRVMTYFEKSLPEVRDEVEDAALLRIAEKEGMPKNVADFKGHPVYVLERHLRQNEVIQPRREVGKVTVGAGDRKKLESVFRRRDVYLCRSPDAWYRRGRDVKEGVEPLKFAAPRTRLEREEAGEEEDVEGSGMALFAEYQTQLYVPPPVIIGQIPRNKFGNLDVYVQSMIPPGGIHVRHPLAAKAAQVLGISFTDAVTGFEFKGRQGTAVIDGVVVSEDQRMAMVVIIVGLQTQMKEEIEAERSRIVLSVWQKWLQALRVRERIRQDYGGDEAEELGNSVDHDLSDKDDDAYVDDAGGGFMPDPDGNLSAENERASAALVHAGSKKKLGLPPLPPIPSYHEIIVIESPHKAARPATVSETKVSSSGGNQEAGGFVVEDDNPLEDAEAMGGGGFLLDEEDKMHDSPAMPSEFATENEVDDSGGGFIPEDDPTDDQHTSPTIAASQKIVIPDIPTVLANPPPAHHQHSPPDEPTPTSNGNAHLPDPSSTDHIPPAGSDNNTSRPQNHTKQQDHITIQEDAVPQDSSRSSLGSQSSMLSHDPDEEDAEPEWLIDSLS